MLSVLASLPQEWYECQKIKHETSFESYFLDHVVENSHQYLSKFPLTKFSFCPQRIDLGMVNPGPYGNDIATPQVEVTFVSSNILRVRIFDEENPRWEGSFEVLRNPTQPKPTTPREKYPPHS